MEITLFHSQIKKSIPDFNLLLKDCQRKLVNKIPYLDLTKKKNLAPLECLGCHCDNMREMCHSDTLTTVGMSTVLFICDFNIAVIFNSFHICNGQSGKTDQFSSAATMTLLWSK